MARPRAADHDDKRRAILAAATELFARSGFDRASIGEIASACGVSKGLVYHYYASKDALLYDVIDEHLRTLLAAVAAADDPTLAPDAHLGALVEATLIAYRDADLRHRVQINELEKLPEARQEELRRLEREIVTVFARAVGRVNPRLGEPRNALLRKPVTMALFGIMNWSYLWFRDGGPLTREAYAAVVTRLFVDGVARLGE